MAPDDIAAISDPVQRAIAAQEALDDAVDLVAQLSEIRRDAVRELRAQGLTWQEVADLLGIARTRASHLLDP